jgi:hypothetical protein
MYVRSLYTQTRAHAPRILLAVRPEPDLCGGRSILVALVLVVKTSIALALRHAASVAMLFSVACVLMLAVLWRL